MTEQQFNASCASLSAKLPVLAAEILADFGYSGFVARDDAPGTFEDLLRTHDERPYGDLFPVYAGGSDATVYASPEVNYAFRAWHDMLHIRLAAPFTVEGEIACAKAHCAYPGLTDHERKILWADIVEQLFYERERGHFPEDQRAFMMAKLVA